MIKDLSNRLSRRRRVAVAIFVALAGAFVITLVKWPQPTARCGGIVLFILLIARDGLMHRGRTKRYTIETQPSWARRIGLMLYLAVAVFSFVAVRMVILRWLSPALSSVAAIGVAATACISVGVLRYRRRERQKYGPTGISCQRCGYDLRFNHGCCPECGAPCIAHTGRFADVIRAPDELL